MEERRNQIRIIPMTYKNIEYGGLRQDFDFKYWHEDGRGGYFASYQGVNKKYCLSENTLNNLFEEQKWQQDLGVGFSNLCSKL